MSALTEKDWQLIEDKIREQISPKDEAVFSKKMESADFQKAYKNEQLIYQGILESGDQELKAHLQKMDAKIQSEPSRIDENLDQKNTSNLTWLRWIFIVLIAALAIYFAIQKYSSSDKVQSPAAQEESSPLLAELYAPYPNTIYNLERSTAQTAPLDPVFRAYNQGQYQAAYTAIEQLSEEFKTRDMQFYVGQTLFALGRYEEARQILFQAGKYGENFEWHCKYYIGLCLWEMDRPDDAISVLDQMNKATTEQYWKDRSQKALGYYRSELGG